MRLFILLIMFVFLPVSVLAAQLSGRVMFGGKPAEGVKVSAYEAAPLSEGRLETLSGKDGYFNFSLEKGKFYFIEAEKSIAGKLYKGFSGKNPVFTDGDAYVGIKLLPVYEMKAVKKTGEEISVKGEVLHENKPLQGARVYFYLSPKDFKGMPYMYSEPADNKGRFKIKGMIEGNYFIVARKKKDAAPLGPVTEGDFIGFLPQNPVYIKSGHEYRIKVPVFMKEKEEAPSLSAVKERVTIKGRAVDKDGKPVSGVYAFAYKHKEMGHERPVSISNKTGADGYFELAVPEKGRYYLGVRELYGGTPVQGELYGLYDGSFDHHLVVEKETSGLEIMLKRILR